MTKSFGLREISHIEWFESLIEIHLIFVIDVLFWHMINRICFILSLRHSGILEVELALVNWSCSLQIYHLVLRLEHLLCD